MKVLFLFLLFTGPAAAWTHGKHTCSVILLVNTGVKLLVNAGIGLCVQ